MADKDSRRARAASFETVAEVYDRARPGYPPEAVAWLAGAPPKRVADVGAGTGKLTRGLVALGHRAVAVDPSPAMLGRLRAALPDVPAHVGAAEELPLEDASVDVVTVAQAFHWLDHERALPELARVLRPGGVLALVWNARDEREPWVGRLTEVIGAERVEGPELQQIVAAGGLFGPLEHRAFLHAQRLDRRGLLELTASRSLCATRGPAERERILARVGEVFDGAAEDGQVVLPYVADCFRARKA